MVVKKPLARAANLSPDPKEVQEKVDADVLQESALVV